MPIKRCSLPNGDQGYQWGNHGKCFASRDEAEKQAAAAHANGFVEKSNLCVLLGKTDNKPKKTNLAILLKGDVEGHEFHGNQYQIGSVGEVGGNKDYGQLRGGANTATAVANRSGDASDHQEAARIHREAAEAAKHSLSTRAAVLTHLRLAEEHESKSGGATRARSAFQTEEKSLGQIIAERRAAAANKVSLGSLIKGSKENGL